MLTVFKKENASHSLTAISILNCMYRLFCGQLLNPIHIEFAQECILFKLTEPNDKILYFKFIKQLIEFVAYM